MRRGCFLATIAEHDEEARRLFVGKMLDIVKERNPELVRTAVELHQSGQIRPDTYVVDLDRVRVNARLVKGCGDRLGLRLYLMTKQWNRNPSINRTLAEEGLDKAVAVDAEGAIILNRHGTNVSHVGHLAQIPRHMTETIMRMEPEVWTVYGYRNAVFVSETAQRLGVEQNLLLKVVGPDDMAYTAQEGGIPLRDVVEVGRRIRDLPSVRVVGVTGFPTMTYDFDSRSIRPLPNMASIAQAAKTLESELGIEMRQINCPGTSSCESMEVISRSGGTDAEPGSSLWGMAPQQLFGGDVGTPAQVYVTEVSHYASDRVCVIGGGFYPDSRVEAWEIDEAFVGSSPETILEDRVRAEAPESNWMDYYAWLYPGAGRPLNAGDSAVYFFRPQIFFTRASHVATVNGISDGSPKVEAIYDRGNHLVSGS